MRSFIALAVRRRVAVLMTALAVVAFGIVGYQRLALDLLPDISYPSLTVQTDFPDTAPAEVENLVTRPVEEAVGVLKGLKTIHSVSRSGVSEVTLEFEWGSDMDLLSMDVRDKLDRLVLPEEADDPIVLRFDPSLDPVMRLALSGPSDLARLRRIADKQVKQEFETIRGVAAAQIKGGLEEEIQVDVQQERLAAVGIPLSRVGEVVGVSNVNLPGGSLEDQQSQYLIRTVNEYDTVEEIGGLILRRDERGTVRLADVAEVRRGAKEREEITRVDGTESIEIAIFKEGDANTVSTARAGSRAKLGPSSSGSRTGSTSATLVGPQPPSVMPCAAQQSCEICSVVTGLSAKERTDRRVARASARAMPSVVDGGGRMMSFWVTRCGGISGPMQPLIASVAVGTMSVCLPATSSRRQVEVGAASFAALRVTARRWPPGPRWVSAANAAPTVLRRTSFPGASPSPGAAG